MTKKAKYTTARVSLVCLAIAGGMLSSTGCQVSVAGQTLPSPHYLEDDIQYFPAGPMNKLALETAELKKQAAQRASSGF